VSKPSFLIAGLYVLVKQGDFGIGVTTDIISTRRREAHVLFIFVVFISHSTNRSKYPIQRIFGNWGALAFPKISRG
jgi:hypothetical protein